MSRDPFRALGLPAAPDLTDDDVRAAWRRIAAATHPDRDDGGDPTRFALAAAAYTELRTRYGRGEAYADLMNGRREWPPTRQAAPAQDSPGQPAPQPVPGTTASWSLASRVRHGRPGVLVLRVALAAAISAAAFVVTGAQPAAIGLSAGVLTWLLLTARHDLAR